MESSREILEEILAGWRKHHKSVGEKIKKISSGQNPKILSLCCSDSRIDLDFILGVKEQGELFQVRNVGGLFTEDAKAAFVYALKHLNPHVILIIHHTLCGGYSTLQGGEGVEPEILYYMLENGGGLAKLRVDEHLKSAGKKASKKDYKKAVVEEGARIQVDRILYFFKVFYPKVHAKIKNGKTALVPLVYDLENDGLYLLPENIEASLNNMRQPINKLVL